jgi:hypothetical protein
VVAVLRRLGVAQFAPSILLLTLFATTVALVLASIMFALIGLRIRASRKLGSIISLVLHRLANSALWQMRPARDAPDIRCWIPWWAIRQAQSHCPRAPCWRTDLAIWAGVAVLRSCWRSAVRVTPPMTPRDLWAGLRKPQHARRGVRSSAVSTLVFRNGVLRRDPLLVSQITATVYFAPLFAVSGRA